MLSNDEIFHQLNALLGPVAAESSRSRKQSQQISVAYERGEYLFGTPMSETDGPMYPDDNSAWERSASLIASRGNAEELKAVEQTADGSLVRESSIPGRPKPKPSRRVRPPRYLAASRLAELPHSLDAHWSCGKPEEKWSGYHARVSQDLNAIYSSWLFKRTTEASTLSQETTTTNSGPDTLAIDNTTTYEMWVAEVQEAYMIQTNVHAFASSKTPSPVKTPNEDNLVHQPFTQMVTLEYGRAIQYLAQVDEQIRRAGTVSPDAPPSLEWAVIRPEDCVDGKIFEESG